MIRIYKLFTFDLVYTFYIKKIDLEEGGSLPFDLSSYRVPGVPETVDYVPDFITPQEESLLLREIERSPAPRS